MDALFAAIEATTFAQTLRASRWGYAFVSAAHIAGIALLVGATLPLQLRLLGLWRDIPQGAVVRILSPVAVCGLALAICAGLLLFSIRAREYAGNPFLQAKVVLVLVGAFSAIAIHRTHGFLLENAGRARLRVHAAVSMACWIGALVCGRMIAFAAN